MPNLKNALNPSSYVRFLIRQYHALGVILNSNYQSSVWSPPGHYYSPHLDLSRLAPLDGHFPFDGPECWEHIDMRPDSQRALYVELLRDYPLPAFPTKKGDGNYRYFTENGWFEVADAFTLQGLLRKEKPGRIVEIGSGFSSAVMLDTLAQMEVGANITFIEPFPDRLNALLRADDQLSSTLIESSVQEIPLSLFDQLQSHDFLFIDSSHVAKVGSDVTFILLRVLPRLKPGVLIHFHDVFYPFSYPISWLRNGCAWNESIFLRAFLLGNPAFQIEAFNSFASHSFPEVFQEIMPAFLTGRGASLWVRKL